MSKTTKKKPTPKKKVIVKKKKYVPHTKGGFRGGIIKQIIDHYLNGLSNAEIAAKGFSAATVATQVGRYKRKNKTEKIAKKKAPAKKKIAPKKKKKA